MLAVELFISIREQWRPRSPSAAATAPIRNLINKSRPSLFVDDDYDELTPAAIYTSHYNKTHSKVIFPFVSLIFRF